MLRQTWTCRNLHFYRTKMEDSYWNKG